jgi:hypothetical protein
MGQAMTVGMRGRLQLSIDGSSTARPLDVDIGGIRLDLDKLMASGCIQFSDDPSKVKVRLTDVTFWLLLDADEVLSRGAAAIVHGLEEVLQE